MKNLIPRLTKRELEAVILLANFSSDQEAIFRALNTDDKYDYAIINDLCMCERKYYKLKKIVMQKTARILQEMGLYNDII